MSSEGQVKRQVTIDEYVGRWADKLVHNGFSPQDDDNIRMAADHLLNLLKRIAEKGEKEDVRVPLRILRDLITEAWRNAARAQRDKQLYVLFQMYVGVFERLIPPIFNAAKKQMMEQVQLELKIMEELRLRYYKLVTGETWKDYPELRLIALRQMRQFALEGYQLKKELARQLGVQLPDESEKAAPKRKGFTAKLSGPQTDTWENTFEDVVNTSSEKLFPLIKLLLIDPEAGVLEYTPDQQQQNQKSFQVEADAIQESLKLQQGQGQKRNDADKEKPEGKGTISSLIDLNMDLSNLDEVIPAPSPPTQLSPLPQDTSELAMSMQQSAFTPTQLPQELQRNSDNPFIALSQQQQASTMDPIASASPQPVQQKGDQDAFAGLAWEKFE